MSSEGRQIYEQYGPSTFRHPPDDGHHRRGGSGASYSSVLEQQQRLQHRC
jgi:hypothetical protein